MSRHENTEHTSLENMLNFLFITIIKPIVIKNMPCHAHVHVHVKNMPQEHFEEPFSVVQAKINLNSDLRASSSPMEDKSLISWMMTGT